MTDEVPHPGSTRGSRGWHWYLVAQYRLLRLLDPPIRLWVKAFGLGITVELRVKGRRTGHERSVLVGLLDVGGRWYVGHPNGDVQWTRNLRDAGRGELAVHGGPGLAVTATALEAGPERTAAIIATASQQPWPGNWVYRLARRHVLAVGSYFRLESGPPGASGASRETATAHDGELGDAR